MGCLPVLKGEQLGVVSGASRDKGIQKGDWPATTCIYQAFVHSELMYTYLSE